MTQMLTDKDRIFTNIYGIHDKSLKGAVSRGDCPKQARALAKDGVAEYIKVFGKKPR
jgi:NADH-quinone oxidoreductase subunit F